MERPPASSDKKQNLICRSSGSGSRSTIAAAAAAAVHGASGYRDVFSCFEGDTLPHARTEATGPGRRQQKRDETRERSVRERGQREEGLQL